MSRKTQTFVLLLLLQYLHDVSAQLFLDSMQLRRHNFMLSFHLHSMSFPRTHIPPAQHNLLQLLPGMTACGLLLDQL